MMFMVAVGVERMRTVLCPDAEMFAPSVTTMFARLSPAAEMDIDCVVKDVAVSLLA